MNAKEKSVSRKKKKNYSWSRFYPTSCGTSCSVLEWDMDCLLRKFLGLFRNFRNSLQPIHGPTFITVSCHNLHYMASPAKNSSSHFNLIKPHESPLVLFSRTSYTLSLYLSSTHFSITHIYWKDDRFAYTKFHLPMNADI